MWARGQVRRAGSAYIGTSEALAISGTDRLLTNRIYFDHAATTPVIAPSRDAFARGMASWSNPNSPHAEGRAAQTMDELAVLSVRMHAALVKSGLRSLR